MWKYAECTSVMQSHIKGMNTIRWGMNLADQGAWWVIVESYSISRPPAAIAIDVAAGNVECEVSTPQYKVC